jgi:hypothetical protein
MEFKFDFSGYATKASVKCSDGRTIMKHAFKDQDGTIVPLVWQHNHGGPENILGHAKLEDRDGDIYTYCAFNDTPGGQNARTLVQHKDIVSLSIFANDLVEKNKLVHTGVIREVSLVLAGANPGAKIDYISLAHGDDIVVSDEEAIIYMNQELEVQEELSHADGEGEPAAKEKTVGDVLSTLNDEQAEVVGALLAQAAAGDLNESEEMKQSATNSNKQGEKEMKSNVFNKNDEEKKGLKTLTHAQFSAIVADAQKTGSFKQSLLAHAVTYGIENIDYLFPDAQRVGDIEFVKRDMGWVSGWMSGTRHSPFSRIKSMSADLTFDDARAKGYVKGALKKEEFFALSKRTTTPTTVYKKQKLDRDDIVDITDMDVVAWLKSEMRMMLDEEIARAGLIGDGRALESEDKISETNVRSVWSDVTGNFYTHRVELESDATALETIDAIAAARKEFKGTGTPKMFCTPEFLTTMLLLRDSLNHRLYRTTADLAAELRVGEIVEVPVMVGAERTVDATPDYDVTLCAIILNPADYVYGADKGGGVSLFDDFDIDYNQFKYLIETRLSGCLVKPKSAIIVEQVKAGG